MYADAVRQDRCRPLRPPLPAPVIRLLGRGRVSPRPRSPSWHPASTNSARRSRPSAAAPILTQTSSPSCGASAPWCGSRTTSVRSSPLPRRSPSPSGGTWPTSCSAVTMKPPENEQGRPGGQTQDGPDNSDTAARQQRTPPRIRRGRGSQRRDPVTMRVTYLPPSARRTLPWSLGRCPVCGTPHLSRSKTLDEVTQVRQLPCRHWVSPVIARSLSPYGEAA
jgi:hypothetical protein